MFRKENYKTFRRQYGKLSIGPWENKQFLKTKQKLAVLVSLQRNRTNRRYKYRYIDINIKIEIERNRFIIRNRLTQLRRPTSPKI